MSLSHRDRTYFSLVLMDTASNFKEQITKKELTIARKKWYKTRTTRVRKTIIALKQRGLYHKTTFHTTLHAHGCNVRRMFDGMMLQHRTSGCIVKYAEYGYSPAYDVTQKYFK